MEEEIKKFFQGKIIPDEPMWKHTTFRIGGPADLFLEPENQADLINVLKFVREHSIPYLVIGNGSNLLVSDKGVRGTVIRVGKKLGFIEVIDEVLIAGAGTSLGLLSQTAQENSLSGLEFLSGIPGAVGGAVVLNAGTKEGFVSDLVQELEVIDGCCNVQTLSGCQLQFGYRWSNLKSLGYIVVSAKLCLKKNNSEKIREKMEKIKERRKKTQPLSMPSAGCIFRNPPGLQAGRLLELVGAKGLVVGGAQVAQKHANFIVNRGNARADEVVKLMQELQRRVESRFGLKLVPEVQLVGDWEHEIIERWGVLA